MSDTQYEQHLTPAAGLCVIDPAKNEPLPMKGAIVRGNELYWRRRLSDGEVEITQNRKPASSSTTKS